MAVTPRPSSLGLGCLCGTLSFLHQQDDSGGSIGGLQHSPVMTEPRNQRSRNDCVEQSFLLTLNRGSCKNKKKKQTLC